LYRRRLLQHRLYQIASSAVATGQARRGMGLQETILGLSVEMPRSHTASLRSRRVISYDDDKMYEVAGGFE
jgi:hypothetical protein